MADRQLTVKILGDSSGAQKAFNDVEGSSSRMSGALGKVGVVAGAALAGIGVAAGAAALGGIKVAADFQQTSIAFTTMLGSGEKAQGFLTNLRNFAAKTPFEFPELATAASSLVSVGVKADDVIPIMTSLGNATAGMGTGQEGIKRATVALQQMSAAGRITGEDLNQLRDAGIPVFDLLAAATGKTKEQVAALAQSGKLGKKELDQLFEALKQGKGLEKFNGLMDAQSKTLNGVVSTLKDTLSNIAIDFITPYLPAMATALQGLANLIQNVGVPALRSLIDTVSSGLGPFVEGIQQFFSGLTQGTDSLGSSQTMIAAYGAVIRGVFFDTLLPAFTSVREAISNFMAGLTQGTDAIGSNQTVVAAYGAVVRGIVYQYVIPALQAMSEFFVETFSKIAAFVAEIMPQVQEAIGHVLSVIEVLWSIFGSNILRGVQIAFQLISTTISGTLDIIMGIVRLFLAVFNGDWGKAWDAIKQIASGALTVLGGIISAGLAGIANIFSAAWNLVKAGASAAFDGAKEIISEKISSIVTVIKSLPGLITGAADWHSLLTSAGEDLIRGLLKGIDNVKGQVTDKMKGLASSALDSAKGALGIHSPSTVFRDQVGKNIGLGLIEGLDGTGDRVNTAVSRLVDIPSVGMDAIATAASGGSSVPGGGSTGAVVNNYYNLSAPGAYAEPITEQGLTLLLRRTEMNQASYYANA